MDGILGPRVRLPGLLALVGYLAVDTDLERTPSHRGFKGRGPRRLGLVFFGLRDRQLEVDGSFLDADTRVNHRCQEGNPNRLPNDSCDLPLGIGQGFIVVELHRDGLPILDANSEKEVNVGFARLNLCLNHRHERDGYHAVERKGVKHTTDEIGIQACHESPTFPKRDSKPRVQ